MGVIGVLADGLPEAGVVFLQFLLVALLPRLQHLRFLENCTKISWWRPASGRGFEGDQDTTHPGRFRQIKPFLDMLRWDYGGVSILKPSGFSIDGYCLVDWVDWPEVKATTQCPLHQSSGLFGQQGAGEGGKKKWRHVANSMPPDVTGVPSGHPWLGNSVSEMKIWMGRYEKIIPKKMGNGPAIHIQMGKTSSKWIIHV